MPRAQRRCPGAYGTCTELISNTPYCPAHTVNWRGPRTASSQITTTWEWQQLVDDVLDAAGRQCQIQYPGICTGVATVVDKKTPAARRPDLALDPRNHQAACKECNDHKARTEDREPTR